MSDIVLIGDIVEQIFVVRGEEVMMDSDLAKLYGVTTGRLNEQVKRNIKRFPSDFMFRLEYREYTDLMSQNAISKAEKRGGRTKMPYVFTELGVAMLSSVLKSQRAIDVNIMIMRAFVQFRRIITENIGLEERLTQLEKLVKENIRISKENEERSKENTSTILLLVQEIYKPMRKILKKPKGKIGYIKESKKSDDE